MSTVASYRERSVSQGRSSSSNDTAPAVAALSLAYVPATPDSVKSVTFEWSRACPVYTVKGASVWHKGGGELPYRPVLGSLAMQPSSGKYFFSYRINTDNSRAGFCTSAVYSTPEDLQDKEFGKAVGANLARHLSLGEAEAAQPSYLQSIGVVPAPPSKPWEAYIDLQTSKVYVNGREVRHLWRLFLPTCGAVLAFVVDTDVGAVQLFVDGKYEGMMLEEDSGLRGKTVCPCVGISGFDMSNRSISGGYMGAFVNPPHPFDCLY